MKKLFCIILAAAMAFALVSCGAPAEQEAKTYELEDITDAFAWLDKTPADLGIGDEYIEYGISVGIKGKLYGEKASGSVYLNTYDRDEPFFSSVSVFCSDLDSEVLLSELKKLYGDPFATGEEPYVESNGGALYWEDYYTGEGVLRYSMGSENDWYELEYTLGQPSDESMYIKTISVEDVTEDSGLTVDMPDEEFRDLTVQRLWTDPIIYIFSYTDAEERECRVWVREEETDGGLPNIVQYDERWEDHDKWDVFDWIEYDDGTFATVEIMEGGPGFISWFTGDCVYAAAVYSKVTEDDLTALRDRINEAVRVE